MGKVVLTLLFNLLLVIITDAHVRKVKEFMDTLPKTVVNGLNVISVRTSTLSKTLYWNLRVFDLENSIVIVGEC